MTKANASLLLSATLLLTGCGGSSLRSSVVPLAPNAASEPASVAPAGEIRSTMSTTAPATVVDARETQGGYGGTPALTDQSATLYDAPVAGLSAVNLALSEIDVITPTGATVVMKKYDALHIVNLLDLQHTGENIGGKIPLGSYVGIKLVGSVAASSAKTSAGRTIGLVVNGTSGDTFTLPVGISFATTGNGDASLAIDFNLAESIAFNIVSAAQNFASGEKLQLTPLVIAAKNAGNVQGRLVNASHHAVQNATVVLVDRNGHVANSTISAADGSFNLNAISFGTYRIEIYNAYRNAAGVLFVASGNDGRWGSAYAGPTFSVDNDKNEVGEVRD